MTNLHLIKTAFSALLSVFVLIAGRAKAEPAWTAYNDCIRDVFDTTAANVTGYSIYSGSTVPAGGKLKDFAIGSDDGMPTVTFTMNTAVPVQTHADYGDDFSTGTPAYEAFNGIIDFGGTIIQHSGSNGWWVEMKFTDLDPARKYTFVASAIRVAPADIIQK